MAMKRLTRPLGAIVFSTILLLGCSIAIAAQEIHNLKFSKEELQLLKRLDQIQKGAGLSSSMLKTAPFILLFGSPSPEDVAITIATNDWDKILGALKSLQKIQACETVKDIDLWKEVDDNSYSSPASEAFFTTLREKAEAACSA
jgi:hypothetical protein